MNYFICLLFLFSFALAKENNPEQRAYGSSSVINDVNDLQSYGIKYAE